MIMSPILKRNSVTQRFEGSNAIEIHDRTIFDFYIGLPQMTVRYLIIESRESQESCHVLYQMELTYIN